MHSISVDRSNGSLLVAVEHLIILLWCALVIIPNDVFNIYTYQCHMNYFTTIHLIQF